MASKKKETSNTATVEAAEQCLNEIQSNMRNMPAIRELVDSQEIQVGEVFRQGDIYVERVAPGKNEKGEEILNSRQLVDGLTKGSRHCITEGPRLFKTNAKNPRGGVEGNDVLRQAACAIEAKEPFTIHHPEHASAKMPAGSYIVWHQMDYQRQQKVRD